ncbi:carboxypeptidase-like regulatory domain-containing protein [Hymenobacter sp. B1770]|uniref:carboxypeptidase-like regulatory domain-containing protein n=1 Tax=Hymenobacter sp. B1770 TaxID=1718788 RepID=UPI003CE8B7F1
MIIGNAVLAQGKLSGVVLDSVTRQPLPFASVFLANTTFGATTTEQGQFMFPNVPAGTYTVVGSYVGYRLARQEVVVGAAPQQLTLQLGPSANRLGEVVVRADPNRLHNYRTFVDLFLGRTSFSRACRIRNPDDVLIDFDVDKNTLTASAAKFLQVDNQALGYRIKYFGLRFSCNFTEQVLLFYGEPVFEEMTPRNKGQQRRWVANREQAYWGSLTHFLKSVYDNQVAANGFLVQHLRMVPNPNFGRVDSLKRALVKKRYLQEMPTAERDSLDRWRQVPRTFSILYTPARPIDSLRRLSGDGRTFLRFTDYLQVTYLRERPDPEYLRILAARPATDGLAVDMRALEKRQISRLSLRMPENEIQPNGHLVDPLAVFTDEYWGFEKMGEFLPLNYQPPTTGPSPQPPTQ